MIENTHPVISFIRRSVPLSDDLAETISTQFVARKFNKLDFFLQEGKVSNDYLFLSSGYMRSFVYDLEGNEVTVNFHQPGTVVFEVASFFQRTPAQENIQALTDCEGWTIRFESLNDLFHGIPQFREFGRSMLVQGFVKLKIRTLSMINKTAEERYLELMRTKPEIIKHAPLKQIASYLGVTDTSLSRIRKGVVKK